MSMPPNPEGANQYMMDPRQKKCWEAYVNPKSKTFGNARQSAINAGYEEDYANQLTTRAWFKEKVRRLNMLGKGEKVLDEVLDLPVVNFKGETDKGVIDVAKFVCSTLGKSEGYSSRSEVTGADGKDLPIPILTVNYVSKDNSHGQDNVHESENKGDIRRNECLENSERPALLDSLGTVGSDANDNIGSIGVVPTPPEGSNEGLSINPAVS